MPWASAASLSGVLVPCALICAIASGVRPASSMAACIHRTAPRPSGAGAVMWCASARLADPKISPRIFAPRASARLHSSSIKRPAPSEITNPSRPASKGRETPAGDIAFMLPKPATAMPDMPASLPPAITASQSPHWIHRAAVPIAWVPVAQAVEIVSQGP